jgi:hypothetical protein
VTTLVPRLVAVPRPVIKIATVASVGALLDQGGVGAVAELFKTNVTPSVMAPWPCPSDSMVKIPGLWRV